MKKDGYIFWCSKCKAEHAGECNTLQNDIDNLCKQIAENMERASWPRIYYYVPGYNAIIKIDDDGK
jgi:hypothetical protein